MDPNENLKRQRELAAEIIKLYEIETSLNDYKLVPLGNELAEHVQALDEWLAKGGFLPEGWSR